MSEEQPDAWIEKVVKVTSALGMNPVRTRWKLIRWQESRRKAARRREQAALHVGYQHKTCDECGSVQDRDATVCSKCDAKLGGYRLQQARRIGLIPRSINVSIALAFVLLAVYVRVLIAQGGGIGTPSTALIADFGGNWPPLTTDEPWRLLTAIFLHYGLIHLGMNLLSLAVVGPQIEQLYGRLTMLFLFVATGVLANIGSALTGLDGVAAGASGGISGLIGIGIGYGHRLGTPAGRQLRNQMLLWTGYTIIFGFYVGADNRAHAFGALAGAVFGFAVHPRAWLRPRMKPVRAVTATAAVISTLAALAIIFTRTPDAQSFAGGLSYEPHARVCRMHFTGDHAGARAAYAALETGRSSSDGQIQIACYGLIDLRDQCRRHGSSYSENCALVEAAFGGFYIPARSMTEVVNEQYAVVCTKHFAGDAAGAKRAFDELGFGPDVSAVPVATFCDQLVFNRDLCRSEPRTGEEATRCAELERAFGAFTR